MRAPEFWTRQGLVPTLLAPAALAYAAAGAMRRRFVVPWRAPVPVICVGNLIAGGAGKTPVALALGKRLAGWGLDVAYLTRGYGGDLAGPVAVDPARHDARAVGDEPLLLAAVARTWVARDRKAGIRHAVAEGADVMVLDDGFQNPAVHKDLSLLVVDGGYGFGNRRVIPSGPLREPLPAGLARADAVILVGDDSSGAASAIGSRLPVLMARLVPDRAAMRLRERRVVAFAGIGRPGKFFGTLHEIGANVVEHYSFPDHHRYSKDEIMRLAEAAQAAGAIAVTTAKDFVRLPQSGRSFITAVGVELEFADPAGLDRIVRPALKRHAMPHG